MSASSRDTNVSSGDPGASSSDPGASSGDPGPSPRGTSVPADTVRPRIARGYRLQWEEAQGTHVLLYPEGMVKLNGSAGAIMSRCTGERTIAEIVADLESTFGATGLDGDVKAFVSLALEQSWLEVDAGEASE